MRILQAGFLVRRMRSAWLLLTSLMASVLITSVLVSALITFYSGALPAAVRKNLTASGAMSVIASGAIGSSQLLPRQTKAADAWLHRALGSVRYRAYNAIWSDDLNLPRPSGAGNIPVVQAAAIDQVSTVDQIVTGAWPGRPVPGAPIPAALPVTAAAQLKLHAGDVVSLIDRATGTKIRLRLTGSFRPRDAASPYWSGDPIGVSGVSAQGGFLRYGPAVVSAAAFGAARCARAARFCWRSWLSAPVRWGWRSIRAGGSQSRIRRHTRLARTCGWTLPRLSHHQWLAASAGCPA
jgi:hypothetical protein